MKKLLALLLLTVMLLSMLVACAADQPETTTEAQTTTAEPVTTDPPEPSETTEAEEVALPSGLGTPDGMENADLNDVSTLLPLLPTVQLEWRSEQEEWSSLAMIDAENGIAYFRSGSWDHYLFYFDQTGAYTLYYAHYPQLMPEEWTLVTDDARVHTALFRVREVLCFLYPSDFLSLQNEVSYAIAPDEEVEGFYLCSVFRVMEGDEEVSTLLLDKKTGVLVQYRIGEWMKQELLTVDFTAPTFTNLPVTESDEAQ